MLRQELQQTKESLAARDAELRELKGRVADLEKLQADQQQLLTLKDTELAAAQQRLAASNNAGAAPTTAQAQAPATADAAVQPQAQASILPWVLGGFGVLVLALFAAWLLRRRAASTPKFVAPAPMSAASLADAFAPVLPKSAPRKPLERADALAAPPSSPTRPLADAEPDAETETQVTAAPPPASARFEPDDGAPATVEGSALWDRRDRQQLPTGRAEPAAPAWHAGAGKSRLAEAPAGVAVETSVGERLELAQAYLELGDRDSARQLLGEVAANGDPGSRKQASRMLREME